MQSALSINTRLVLRIYAWTVLPVCLVLADYPMWIPAIARDIDLPGVPWGRAGLVRTAAAAIAVFGFAAVGMSRIENPASRRRALHWFAVGHLYFGMWFHGQAYAVFPDFIPHVLGWLPLAVGVVLLFVASVSSDPPRFTPRSYGAFSALEEPGRVVMLHELHPKTLTASQSQYEEHIRQAARVEERTRLARDLHDAVKQQLFAIQTSAATVQERLAADVAGAQSALAQVRTCARDAMTEMKALIEQLQASPLENTGLVASLQQQCEALALRTGADVRFDAGALPPSASLPLGAQQALFRAAQEALSNVARHARATSVTVRLGLNSERLELSIRDNGSGFDPAGLTSGMGMRNMSARLHEVSGAMLVRQPQGGGTLVAFSVPCDFSTPGDYARIAWACGAFAVLMLVASVNAGPGLSPWAVMLGGIAAGTVVRYAAAWRRARRELATAS
jgi:signal transduction histidine kinase